MKTHEPHFHTSTLPRRPLLRRGLVAGLAACGAATFAASAAAQVQFSIDWKGPTISLPDSFGGVPITEGDILMPVPGMPAPGPLPPPGIVVSAGFGPPAPGLGLIGHAPCVGHPPGTPCIVEVDAVSYGQDWFLDPAVPPMPRSNIWFSVDEFALGMPGPTMWAEVATEAPFGEACADVFSDCGLLPGPLPPFAVPPFNVALVDGDGLPSPSGFAYPGLGIFEPSLPPPVLPRPGDNLDALEIESPPAQFPIYFSLDSAFPDPRTGIANSGSAAAHGFVGGDLLITPLPGGPPAMWVPAFMLGLDLLGPDTDDLDALILWENGTGLYEPAPGPYAWVGGQFDMVLFSVRSGSALIGMPDSMLGMPIEPGDILMPPFLPGMPPGILYAAENFGLLTTRSMGIVFGDDLNAADSPWGPYEDCDGDGIEDKVAIQLGFMPDCNRNGVPDPCDIMFGTSTDFDFNGIPDECQGGAAFCFGDGSDGATCPCGNLPLAGSNEGCTNSTGVGAALVQTGGVASVGADTLVLTVFQAAPNEFGVFVQNTSTVLGMPFYDGTFCLPLNATLVRHYAPPAVLPTLTSAAGSGSNMQPMTVGDFAGTTVPGATIHYQFWYRNATGPCLTGANFSSGLSIVWAP